MSATVDSFFEKVNGSYIGLIGLILASLTMFGSIFLYLSVDSSFFVTTNFISDLSVGPNGSALLFALSVIIMGIFFIPFHLFVIRYLQSSGANQKIAWTTFVFIFIYGLSSIALAAFPLDHSNKSVYDIHILVASSLFGSASIALFLYGHMEFRIVKLPKYLSVLSTLEAVFLGVFAVLLLLGNFTQLYSYDTTIYLVEWTGFALFVVWTIIHIVMTLK